MKGNVSRPSATASTPLAPEDGKRTTAEVAVHNSKLRFNITGIQRIVLLFTSFPLDFIQRQCHLLCLVYIHIFLSFF